MDNFFIQSGSLFNYNMDHFSLDKYKWNRGMYNYDKNSSDLVLKRNIIVPFDVPKRVKNVINPIRRRVLC